MQAIWKHKEKCTRSTGTQYEALEMLRSSGSLHKQQSKSGANDTNSKDI